MSDAQKEIDFLRDLAELRTQQASEANSDAKKLAEFIIENVYPCDLAIVSSLLTKYTKWVGTKDERTSE